MQHEEAAIGFGFIGYRLLVELTFAELFGALLVMALFLDEVVE